jgi:hypothetical protein
MTISRIATWNLERPRKGASAKKSRQHEKLRNVDADLWILTETNSAIALDGYHSIASERAPKYHSEGESCVAIMTRWKIAQQIPTNDPMFAACAEVASPFGPMIVYGSIIPYANWRGPIGKSGRWVEHRKSIARHAEDWVRLRTQYTKHEFCFGGDFNQSRDGSGWYEDPESIEALSNALKASAMKCVTDGRSRADLKLKTRSTVDHICLSPKLESRLNFVSAWEGEEDGTKLSDHNGVFVDLLG